MKQSGPIVLKRSSFVVMYCGVLIWLCLVTFKQVRVCDRSEQGGSEHAGSGTAGGMSQCSGSLCARCYNMLAAECPSCSLKALLDLSMTAITVTFSRRSLIGGLEVDLK